MSIRVAFVAAECEPWAKTGGLADVVDALARALGQIGGDALDLPIDVFLPRYRGIEVPVGASTRALQVPDPYVPGGVTEVRIHDVVANGYRLRLVDHPAAFDRPSYYGDATGDYPDNAWRFGLLCRAALEQLRSEPRPPDVIHLHDWHACAAVLLRDGPLRRDPAIGPAAALLTVHNLAYHGWTQASALDQLGIAAPRPAAMPRTDPAATLPASAQRAPVAAAPARSKPEGRPAKPARDAGGLDLLGTGIQRSELVNTVSPGYAAEALGPAYGMGLDGLLRAKGDAFFGILNGLDTDLWNPATDRAIAATYSRANRAGKAACRAALLAEVGMEPADTGAVLAMIGRLDPQKGFDLLADAAPTLLKRGARLVVLGSGSPDLVATLRSLASKRPDRIAIVERFDRDLARRIYAGADGFLMPSRFEPCGTGQMIALRYGTPPIVRATGGLRDTVLDEVARPGQGTGFRFEAATPAALVAACDGFLARFAPGAPEWEALLDRGMAVDFDWRTHSAPAYIEAYRRAIAIRRSRLAS
jgi:starch synthase